MELKHTHSRVYTQVNFLSFCFVSVFSSKTLDVISKPVLIGSHSAPWLSLSFLDEKFSCVLCSSAKNVHLFPLKIIERK